MNDTYCPAPWHGGFFMFDRQSVCCRHKEIPMYSPLSFLASEHVQDIKQRLTTGNLDPFCNQCQAEEKIGTGNLRQIYMMVAEHNGIKLDRNPDSKSVPEYAEIRLGNLCNFKCRMCGPSASNAIATEVDQYPELKEYYRLSDATRLNSGPEFLSDVLSMIPHLKRVQFTGGEPTLVPEVIDILDAMVEGGYSHNININLTTNVSVINPKILERLPHFKSVLVSMSLDAVRDVAEYIRYGTKWNRIVENVDAYIKLAQEHSNIGLHVGMAVTAYSIMTIDQLISFVAARPDIKNMLVMSDNYIFQPNVLQGNSRVKAIKSLEVALDKLPTLNITQQDADTIAQKLTGFKHMLETQEPNEGFVTKFQRATRDLDRIRNQSFEQVFGVSL